MTYYTGTWGSSSSSYANTVLYTGQSLSVETGLFYYRARYYSVEYATFLTRDPAAADFNLYRYCGNEPTNATDASGLSAIKYVPGRGDFYNVRLVVNPNIGGPNELSASFDASWAPRGGAFIGPGGKKMCFQVAFVQVATYAVVYEGWNPFINVIFNNPVAAPFVDHGIPYPYAGLAGYPTATDPTVPPGIMRCTMTRRPASQEQGGMPSSIVSLPKTAWLAWLAPRGLTYRGLRLLSGDISTIRLL